jgi:RHS repeat-associated protein
VSDVASQCGALRISHSLPATTTYGKTSAPTLAYYSDHVAGPQILAKVALNGAAAPDSVEVNTYELDANGNRLGSAPLLAAKFTGVNWAASSTQRFNTGVLWSDPARPTGIYRFDVEVRLKAPGGAWYNAGQAQRGRVAWVNRRGSPFGDGWWMLGLEELYTQGDTVLWVGGDGSTRRYVKTQTRNDTTLYGAPSVARPDTLYRSLSGEWRRALPGRVNVFFDATGRHVKTTNRFNRSTDFTYEAGATARGRLRTITLPAAQTYTLNYFPSAIAINSPGSRQTVITLSSTQVKGIESIQDPDASLVSFGYYSWGVGYAINGRTDRRGTTTTLTWDDFAGTLKQASTPASPTQTVIQSIVSPRGRGAYRGSAQAVAAAEPDYVLDGPRTDVTDVTKIWVDSMGAPRKITDAVGLTTTVERSPAFPGLPDLIVHPGGYAERAFYDARGHIEWTAALNPYGDGRNAWTRYTWDNRWDQITSMTGPEGEMTIFGIDPATGNLISEQRAQVPGSRVDYIYHATKPGLIRSVRTPIPGGGVSIDSLEYDALGNLSGTISPRGRVARFVRDSIGRVTTDTTYLSASSSGPKRVRSTQFDLMDRPFIQVDSAGTDALEVRTFYNAAGAVDSVHQRARPVRVARDTGAADAPIRRSYRYDLLGRKLFEHVGLVAEASWRYDLAGNVVASSKEPGDSLLYDAINRLVRRIGGPDSASYSYDADGNLQEATNAFAKIRRSYYRNGTLRGDTTSVANSALTGFGSTDGFAVQYDLTGRRRAIQMPAGIDGRTISYTYDTGASGTGQVATITDGFSGVGNSFQYDALGRPSIITRRANTAQPIVETRAYDLESNDSVRTIVGGGTTYLNELVTRDLLNRIVKAGTDTNAYDGLGHAVYATNGLQPPTAASIINYDAFGNRVDYKSIGAYYEEKRYIFQGGFNRPAKEWAVGYQPDTTRYVYGADGALAWQETPHLFSFDGPLFQNDSGYVLTERLNQYRGGKMVSSEWVRDTLWIFRSSMQPQPSAYQNIETYRYDALGRRVWQRMVYPDQRCDQTEYESGCQSTITTTVWDGSDILLERRTPSDTGYNGPTSINPYGVVAYVPGFEIDRPFLVLTQGDHDVLPFTNTMGRIMKGACSGAPCVATDVDFPMGRADLYGRPYGLRDRSNWFGSLIQGMADGSGYIYQRNRYLNPSNGTFTQVDPIGLAGGLNVYGFAGGDPVNYRDPFGLASCKYYEIECLSDQLAAWGGGTGVAGRLVVPTIQSAVSIFGLDQVEADASAAASGSNLGRASLAATFIFAAIPGGSGAREARTLTEHMAMNAAKAGFGREIMENKITDVTKAGLMKMQVVVTDKKGKAAATVHYWKDRMTGEIFDFKFK